MSGLTFGQQVLLSFINRRNNLNLNPAFVAFSPPQVNTDPNHPNENTSIVMTTTFGSNLTGSRTIYYNRQDLASWMAKNTPEGILVLSTSVATIGQLIGAINSQYGSTFTSEDFADAPLPPASAAPYDIVISALPTSALYIGALKASLSPNAVTLSQLLTNVDLGSITTDSGTTNPGGGSTSGSGTSGSGTAGSGTSGSGTSGSGSTSSGSPGVSGSSETPSGGSAYTSGGAAPAVQLQAHPRLLLTPEVITAIRQEMVNNTPLWQAVQARYQSHLNGIVALPNGNQYPNAPDMGSGYQGGDYIDWALGNALMYWVYADSNPDLAHQYAAVAVSALSAMSQPYPGNGANPLTDDGYGIRNYGVGMALGYDWMYPFLGTSLRNQIVECGNNWISQFEQGSFEIGHPMSNYYAGYFNAKGSFTLATYEENPNGETMWNDWYTNRLNATVKPYFVAHMQGGGWPEGFGNYGTLSLANMAIAIQGLYTATGIDATSGGFTFSADNADYLMQFTWPSLVYFDDRDTVHANGVVSPPVGTVQIGSFTQTAAFTDHFRPEVSPYLRGYAAAVNKALGSPAPSYSSPDDVAWRDLLFSRSDAATGDYTTLPLSYFAPGMNSVAARSDWSTGAGWSSFRAGPYVDFSSQGEQLRDQGSLAIVRGGVPLLVNTWGWIVHEPNGAADEQLAYNDANGSSSSGSGFVDQFVGNNQLFNVFYTRKVDGSGNILAPFGQYSRMSADGATTYTDYEERGTYTYMQGNNLADMYRTFSTGVPAMNSWTRTVVYLRPGQWVVHDATSADPTFDHYLAWHFPANPVVNGNQLGVTYNGSYVGSATIVEPSTPSIEVAPLYPSSNPAKVWQAQVRGPANIANRDWITVFDVAGGAPAAIQSLANNVILIEDYTNQVVSFGVLSYPNPNKDAVHTVTGLATQQHYDVTVTGGVISLSEVSSGSIASSDKGTLAFKVTGSTVSQPAGYVPYTPPLVISGAAPNGQEGRPYDVVYTVKGGVPPYVVTHSQSALPSGLSWVSDTEVSGIPVKGSATADASWSISVTDSNTPPTTVTRVENVYIAASQPLSMSATPPNPVVGVPYSYQFVSQGGYGDIVYSASGLTSGEGQFSSGGLYTGTFNTVGEAIDFNAIATDSGYPPSAIATPVALVVQDVKYATWDPNYTTESGRLDTTDLVFTSITPQEYPRTAANAPITTPTYFEARIVNLPAGTFNAAVGVAEKGSSIWTENTGSATLGQAYDSTDCAIYPHNDGYGTLTYATYQAANNPYANENNQNLAGTVDPDWAFGLAVNPDNRGVWMRVVGPSGVTPWVGGGDPATNTKPTFTIAGTGELWPAAAMLSSGASVTLVSNAKNFYGATPSGYMPGIPTNLPPGTMPPSGGSTSGSGTSGSGTSGSGTSGSGTSGSGTSGSGTATPMALTGTLPVSGTVGVPYSGTLDLTGTYVAPVSVATASGDVVPWMTTVVEGQTVTASGSPNVTGSYDFIPGATDANGQTASGSVQSITIYPAKASVWGAVSSLGVLSNGGDVLTGSDPSTPALAIGDKAIQEKTYFEIDAVIAHGAMPVGAGVVDWNGSTPIGNNNIGGYSENGVAVWLRDDGYGTYTWIVYNAGNNLGSSNNIGATPEPEYRVAIAVDPATRSVWVTLVWTGGNAGWFGGGDPATGTTPSIVLPGTDPLYPAANALTVAGSTCTAALVSDPTKLIGAAPTGFKAGL